MVSPLSYVVLELVYCYFFLTLVSRLSVTAMESEDVFAELYYSTSGVLISLVDANANDILVLFSRTSAGLTSSHEVMNE